MDETSVPDPPLVEEGMTTEEQRLDALYRYEILDTGAEAEFDDFTRLAARICGTPVAQITFVDRDRQWYKSNFGVDMDELPRAVGFCAHTILESTIMEVPDTLEDQRFVNSPLVQASPGVRFYAGAPLIAPDGSGIGTLCVVDSAPRALTDEQRDALDALSRQIVRQLDLRVAVKRERLINESLASTTDQLRQVNVALEHLVTERTANLAETEARLRQSQKVESIGLLAGGIAHDFNNLLTVINGTAELAAARLPRHDPASRDLEEIVTVGRQAAALTRQLLAFSRRKPSRVSVVDVNTVVDNMSLLLSRLISKKVEVVIDACPEPLPVMADGGQLDQVVLNLAVNARDAMPDGGVLHIRTRPTADGGASVSVSDTGCGMDEATRARIFEPFFTTKPVDKGTGLGLSTVHSIVSQSGGTISVSSVPGRGTTFTIALPAVAVRPPITPPVGKFVSESQGGDTKIAL